MEIDEKIIKNIVEKVVEEYSSSGSSVSKVYPGVFDDMDKAVYEASKAFKNFPKRPLRCEKL